MEEDVDLCGNRYFLEDFPSLSVTSWCTSIVTSIKYTLQNKCFGVIN